MNNVEKNPFFTATTALLIIVLAFSSCEIVMRIYNRSQNRTRPIWIPDTYLGLVHSPNNKFLYEKDTGETFSIWHETNALGLLGGKIDIDKPIGTERVLVLGDSFTEAFEVSSEENFCTLLQRYFDSDDAAFGKTYEVVNAGVSGYSPISEYLYLRRDLIELEPDVIVVQLFADDVFEDHKARAMSVLDKEKLPVKISRYFLKDYQGHPPLDFEKTQNISVFEQIHNVLIKTSWYIQYLHSRSFKAQENTDYNKEMMALPQFNDNEQFFIIQEDSPFFKDGTFVGVTWQNTKRYLLAIKGLAEERNAKVVFLYIPLRNQMGILDSGADVPLEFRRPASTYLNELLEKFSQREEVGFLDMLPVFEANKDEELYYINGGTLTPKGHRLVAQELFEFLNAQENGGL